MHRNSFRALCEQFDRFDLTGVRALELGPDPRPPDGLSVKLELARRGAGEYAGSDYGDDLPAGAGYDLVVAANVLEHVPAPWAWLRTVAELTAVGGHVVLVAPVSWPYHPAPKDCWRAYPDGLAALMAWAGLRVVATGLRTEPRAEDEWLFEHGPGQVVDCWGVGRRVT